MSRHNAMLADKKRTRPTKVLLGVLWVYLKEYKRSLFLISGVILAYTLAATFQPIIIQRGLDLVIKDGGNSNELLGLIIIFSTLSIFIWIFQSMNTWIMASIRTNLVHDVRTDTFAALVKADMGYHHKNQSGNITSRVVSDTDQISTGLNVFTQTTTQLLLIIATLAVLFYINVIFVIISLLAVPVALLVAKFFGTIGKKRMLQTRQAYGHVSGKLAENLAGVAIAKSFNQEERVSNEIRKLNDKAYNYMKQLYIVFISVFPAISMVSTFLVYGILVAGGFLTDTSSITIGTIYLGTVMVQRFLQPLIQLANNFTQLQASLAAIDRIADVRDAKPSVQDKIGAKPLRLDKGQIQFQNVSFAYETNTQVLSDINLEIPAGKKIALVGHTGAGKTTITSLLMRFYDPTSGTIMIDGQNIKDVTLASLYNNISLVSQEPYLFADTVLENIRYGKHDASDEDIYDLCELIGANEFIEALPDSYQTKLQESGKSLSAGQRQMITIARTMLSDPKILVLDEATSRLDAYSEALVQNAQRILFEGRTTIIIAHRLSTIRDVDNIIVIDQGKIKETGNHRQLMANNATYAELYNMYYAHQSIGPLEVAQLLASGEEVSITENGKLNLITLLEQKIEFYEEQIGIPIRFIRRENEEFLLEINDQIIGKIIDSMFHKLGGMAKMTQSTPKYEFSVIQTNGTVQIKLSDFASTIPDKMLKMMKTSKSGSHFTKQSSPNQKTLQELVKDVNGKFELVSPIAGKASGTQFITSIPLNK